MSTIQERLKIIMKTHRLTAASFADKVGVQRSGVSHIMSGRNKPSLDFIQKTLNAFPRVNGDWLVTGRNIQPKDSSDENENEIKESISDHTTNVTNNKDTSVTNKESTNVTHKQRKIEKVILFYSDGTYDITYPKRE
jgi:transcriptional regulator with XRE-family HTH domain